MKDQARIIRIEPRWPVASAIIAVVALQTLLPGRVRLFPAWMPCVAGSIIIAAMAAVSLAFSKGRWLRIERTILLFSITAIEIVTAATLAMVVGRMLFRSSEISGLQLLASSIAVWVNNVLAFSLLYWHIDRGGPEARLNDGGQRPDWLFPQTGVPEQAPPDWRPDFVDYLFLAFSTATAFSTTDVMPLTARAKLFMMLESAVSLSTLVVVAARAINLLGS